jgi:hypothetical protein
MKIIASILACVVLLCPTPGTATAERDERAQVKTDLAAPIQSFTFFIGKWHCEGKFANGTAISASVSFEPILSGNFLLFKHDDEPPFGYHAWAEWGWEAASKEFVSTIQDLTGGIRLFRSPGWKDQALVWTGGNLPDSTDQKFVFERMDTAKFRVSYSYKKNGLWVAVDSSVCSRAEANPE